MIRKTIAIADLVATTNRMLAVTADDMREFRTGVAAVLESALNATGNYAGYSFLASELDNDGAPILGYDDTRRVYFHKVNN